MALMPATSPPLHLRLRLTSIPLVGFLLFALLPVMAVVANAPANADTHCNNTPGNVGACESGGNRNDGGDPPPPGSNPPPPGEERQQGGVWEKPDGYFSNHYFWYDDRTSPPVKDCLGRCGQMDTSGETRYYNNRCVGGNRWGPYDGVEGFEAGRYTETNDGEGITSYKIYSHAWFDCIPAASYWDQEIKCVYDTRTIVRGPMSNPEVAEYDPAYFDEQSPVSAFARGGSNDPDLCTESWKVQVSKRLRHYGRYDLQIIPRIQECKIRTYYRADRRTSRIPAPFVHSCSGPRQPNEVPLWLAQLFCERPGWAPDWSGNRTYTTEDCLTNDEGIWNCGPEVNRVPRLAGRRADPVSVLDDGKNRTLRWPILDPEGDLRNIEDKQVSLRWPRNKGGSPYRDGFSPAASNQPFVVDPALNSQVHGWRANGSGNNTEFDVNWQTAGVPGHPWKAFPRWRFTAEFLFTEVTIEEVDLSTNPVTVKTSTSEVWKRLPAFCDGRPAEVNVHRARNSTN